MRKRGPRRTAGAGQRITFSGTGAPANHNVTPEKRHGITQYAHDRLLEQLSLGKKNLFFSRILMFS